MKNRHTGHGFEEMKYSNSKTNTSLMYDHSAIC